MRERLEHRAGIEWVFACSTKNAIRGRNHRTGSEGSNRLGRAMTSSIWIFALRETLVIRDSRL